VVSRKARGSTFPVFFNSSAMSEGSTLSSNCSVFCFSCPSSSVQSDHLLEFFVE
jgi:hypothetical protein